MIVVTGAAGFIGSCLIERLNQAGYRYIVAVDDFSALAKKANYQGKSIVEYVDRRELMSWLHRRQKTVEFIFHMGARTDTTEQRAEIFDTLNLRYSQALWQLCTQYQIPLVYASSAATYGAGEMGYDDDHELIPQLKPMNPYGWSKQHFDMWVLEQKEKPFFWAGLKFFNVYGPNEYHKGRMASVVFHAFRQIEQNGSIRLFRSHRPDVEDGKQMRDFIYVKDVVEVCLFLMEQRRHSGIYNLGTGQARAFLDLALSVFRAMKRQPHIEFIDTPADIRDKYQYFTQANINKLRAAGYEKSFTTLEQGVEDYVQNYLLAGKYY